MSRTASILGLDHVLLAMPRGGEDEARRFYAGVLGLAELEKPVNLAKRGGVWFALGEQQLHLGVDDGFRPALKAHPAILVQHIGDLRETLASQGFAPIDDEPLPGFHRFYVADPFGNRLEFLERTSRETAASRRKERSAKPRFTDTQGQYLAYIASYFRMFHRAPAETDMQRHFEASPPSVHQMVLTLERRGFISRQPGVARSIQILVPPEEIPPLR